MDYDEQTLVEETLLDEVRRLNLAYAKLEKKYFKLQNKTQKQSRIMSKQSKRIQMLSGRKDPFHNEPLNVRRAKGKRI